MTETFIRRWRRRKENAAADGDGVDGDVADEKKPELQDADMPPVASLDETSDVSPFLSPKVSAALRKRALRTFFRLPMFNVRDGLDDYDDDFTSFAPLGDIVTADARHQAERTAAADGDTADGGGDVADGDGDAGDGGGDADATDGDGADDGGGDGDADDGADGADGGGDGNADGNADGADGAGDGGGARGGGG